MMENPILSEYRPKSLELEIAEPTSWLDFVGC